MLSPAGHGSLPRDREPEAGQRVPVEVEERQVLVRIRRTARDRDERGLPVHGTRAERAGNALGDRLKVAEEVPLPLRRRRIPSVKLAGIGHEVPGSIEVVERPRVGRLDDHNLLPVARGEIVEVLSKVRQRAVPPRIEGNADDIVVESGVLEVIEEPPAENVAGTVVHVDDGLRLVGGIEAVAHRRDAGRKKARELRPLLRGVPGAPLPAHATVVPQEAAADLVPDLDVLRKRTRVAEPADDRVRVRVDGVDERRGVQTFPGRGLRLVSRVGPRVGVVEIEQEIVARHAHLLRERECRVETVPRLRRHVPQPQANESEPVVLEDVERVRGLAVDSILHPE